MASSVVILIISHKQELTPNELLSVKQCYRLLGEYPIKIITPEGNDVSFYKKHLPNPVFEFVHPEWLNTYENFNKFKIDYSVYQRYTMYKHILFYEPDAFVFDNQLDFWCKSGYDYIGAPWSGLHLYNNRPLSGVGNGGFSLRKVKSSLKLLRKLRYVEVLEEFRHFSSKGIIPRLPAIFSKMLEAKKTPSNFEKAYFFQEDVFWAIAAPQHIDAFSCNSKVLKFLASVFIKHDFKIAPVESALQFSFETNPRQLFKINNNSLPFGCHAWEKYDPGFWEPYIQKTVKANEFSKN